MNRFTLIGKLNEDLTREYAHWHFYMFAASVVGGLHREEIREFFLKEAAGEMQHITEFSDLIVGLGVVPRTDVAYFNNKITNTAPALLLAEALRMEQEVVKNYVQRMDDAESLESEPDILNENTGLIDISAEQNKIDGRYIHIFLEDQILDSRKAIDEIKLMLKKV